MTTNFPRSAHPTPVRVATVTLCLMLGGCTVVGDWWSGEKTDYKGASKRTQPLDIPPDLTQLQRDSRYLPQGGSVTASDMAKGGGGAGAGAGPDTTSAGGAPVVPGGVALTSAGDLHLVRQGDRRWLATSQSPEAVWPKVRDYWVSNGYTFIVDDPKTGILETDWKENRAKLPSNFIRDALGKVVDGLFDSGMRDRYRTRLERQPDGGTEIFLTQFGATEEVIGFQKSETQWVPRPNDPGLEAQMMSEMMLSLGGVANTNLAALPAADAASGPDLAAAAIVGNPTGGSGLNGAARARVVPGQAAATMQVDDNFDRSWRRVGLALDHGGFTVEDRDRAQGLYYVRFVDAKEAAKDDNGFLAKVSSFFGRGPKSPVGKYRIFVKAPGDSATVTVLDDQGQPTNDANAQRIVTLLVDELK